MNISLLKDRMLPAVLTLALLLALLPQAALSAAAEDATTTFYRLDTGVSFLWKHANGVWQKGWEPGSTQSYGTVLSLPQNVKNVKVYRYDGDNFDFDNPAVYLWNPTAYATGRGSYNGNYNKYSADPLIVSGANSYIPANGTLTVNYTATFDEGKKLDVKKELAKGDKNYIYALLGNPTQEVIEAMNLLDPSSENYSPNVEGYLWFLPIVIQYDSVESLAVNEDAFDAILELPKTARVDETYTAKDVSEIGGDLTVKNAELMKRVKGESTAWSPVVTWPGKGKGQNTGGKKDEKASKPCEIEYRLIVTATNGKTDEDIKTIKILAPDEEEPEEEEANVDPDISLTAKLALPETVYEGHSVIAQDQSNYTVDGKSYSADAAYNEFGARHEFKPSAGANAEVRGNYEGVYTDASIAWPKIGDYEVTLRIGLKGNSDTDTKPIEVLKTPAIVDNLGGRQKQNRKQTLTASIATNPRYPLANAWMEVTEKATGETVRLRPGGTLQNTEHIKTRAMEDADSNAYFTKLEFPFLTKWGDTREFSYTIYAEDTRGQTDTVTKDFTVVPDRPPTPEILLPTTFFREKGTNVAKMEATDLSHSEESDPGDELERTWYVSWPGAGSPAGGGFANAKTIAGYEELSFEEGKEIAFDKTGVGPVSVKVFLKDVWTDETLSEYVTDADYLTAESAVYDTVVSNIAPVVTLSPRAAKSADLLLLAASDAEYNNLLVRKNEIDGALIEKGIDAKISIRKLGRLPSSASAFTQTRSNIVGNTLRSVAIGEDAFCVLSGTLSIVTNGSNSAAYVTAPYYITAYDAYSDAAKWSVQAPKALADLLGSGLSYDSGNALTIGQDDKGKYWYFVVDKNTMNRKSFLFDKTTGAHVKTFDYALGKYNYIEGTGIYSLRADGIYKYGTSGNPERVFSGEISGESALVGGKARFFTQASSYAYMADFDPVTEKATLIRLSNIARNNGNVCVGLDNTGAMLVRTPTGTSFFDKSGRFVRSASNDSIPVKNGEGKMTYAASLLSFRSGRNGSAVALELTDLYTGASIRKNIQSSSVDSIYVHPLYGFDNGNGTVHVQIGRNSNDLGSGWGDSYNHGPGTAGLCAVNVRTGEIQYTAHSGYLGYDDGRAEHSFASDSLYAVGWSLGSYNVPPPYDDAKHKVLSIPRDGDQILAQTTASLMTNDAKDFKTVIVAEDSASKFDVSGAKFKAALGNTASVKLSDTGSVTLASAIAQRITDAGLTARKTAVVQKAPGSDAGVIERSFTLDPQKTYYYEYEANSADKAADQPLVISQENASALPGSDNMYVQDSYFEDFESGVLTGFFDIDKAALDPDVLRNWKITFEVPRGVLGVLSFDFFLRRAGGPDSFAYLHSDGEVVHRLESTRNGGYLFNWNGHYVHSALLTEGTHTIKSEVYMGSATIYNLKFETLVASPPESEAWSAKADDIGGGWTRYTGSFNTPRLTFSYAVQGGTHVYGEDQSYAGTKFAFSSARDMQKIRNFSVWYLENGIKTYVMQDSLESASELAAWQTVNATAAIVDEKPVSEEKEKGALVYKKGELILYGIGYTDYENDPSKESFWRYTHTPFNDGEHADAAVIMSKTGETLKVTNKVLPASIDRFYIDGKYVVEHWQRDNTDRTNAGNAAVNYLDYNKYSNTETMTFYIEGGGEAPWVTGIRTNPDPVREGGGYTIKIGVDDLEKDDLTVLVEVYYEGKEVYRYLKEDVKADEAGNYPTVVTGLAPAAEAGDYTVVVTVWDKDGTGLGDHSFIVITEGRIEGEVLHTDLWEENRKRYNRKLFGEEVNRTSVFADYAGLAAPRPRGANVFWSGERFMLRAGVAGNPLSVSCAIDGYPAYATAMTNSGRKNAAEEWIYEGSVWKNDMINRWGRTAPVELTFVFTAHYAGGITKTHEARIIVDTHEDYRQLHRYY